MFQLSTNYTVYASKFTAQGNGELVGSGAVCFLTCESVTLSLVIYINFS
jgi:hypothetical protein